MSDTCIAYNVYLKYNLNKTGVNLHGTGLHSSVNHCKVG